MNSRLLPLFARRTIRKFTDQFIEDSVVHDLLEAAMAAPSAVGKDPWHFIVVRNPESLRALAASLENGRHLAHASVGIAVCADAARANDGQLEYAVMDCSAAMTNLLLAASMLDLGGGWCGLYPHTDRIALAREVLSIPNAILPLAIAALGGPAQRAEPRTRFRAGAIHLETW